MRRGLGVAALGSVGAVLAACGGFDPAAAGNVGAGSLDGRGLYAAHCALCHGGDLKGTRTGPPLLGAVYRPGHHADAAFLVAMHRGSPQHHWNFGPMAPVPGLTDAQVASITAFVRAEQRAAGIP